MHPIAQLEGVGVRFGSQVALRHISLIVKPGSALGITGANGAGKTTLLRVLATLQRPSAGRAEVLGADTRGNVSPDIRRRIGILPHRPTLWPELTLLENVGLVADLLGLSGETARSTLEKVGLGSAAQRRADHASNGMQRRCEFARLVLQRPDLLLLDEPHAGLDEPGWDLVADLVRNGLAGGGAAVLVSHEKQHLTNLCQDVLLLTDGQLDGQSSP